MKQLWLALLIACLGLAPAQAQQVTNPQPNAGTYAAYNSSLPTCVNGSGCWLQTDLNGNLKIAIASGGGSGGTASTFGAAFPATGTAVGFTDGTNMVSGRVRNPGSGALVGDAAIVVVDPVVLAAVNSATPAGGNNIGSTSPAPNVTATACSGTIATGGTAQNAFTAQTTLHGFTIANIDTTEPLWISFTATAAASGTDSYPLPAATASTFAGFGSFTTPPGFGLNHALSVVAATSTHKYSCTWW